MDDKRQAIIDAAGRLLQQGSRLSVDTIAETAGVAKGTVYLYFDSKQDVIHQTLLSGLEDSIRRVTAARSRQRTSLQRLCAMLDVYHAIVSEGLPVLHRCMSGDMDLSVSGGEFQRQGFEGLLQLESVVVEELAAGISEGEFVEHEPDIAAGMLLAAIHSLAFRELITGTSSARDLVVEILHMVLGGIATEFPDRQKLQGLMISIREDNHEQVD